MSKKNNRQKRLKPQISMRNGVLIISLRLTWVPKDRKPGFLLPESGFFYWHESFFLPLFTLDLWGKADFKFQNK